MRTFASPPLNRTPRHGLGASEAFVGIGALGGAMAMYFGAIDLGTTVNRRLPFHSPTFGASALVVCVGLPMLIGALRSWRGAPSANFWAFGAGVILMGWIVVEMIIIRGFSPLHPIYFFAGAAIAAAGYRPRRNSPPRSDGRL